MTAEGIAEINGFTYFADINPLYSDLLDPEVTEKFIEFSYRPYIDKAPDIDGFFTDEPQLARMRGIPWSDTLPSEWKKAYGTDILPLLPCLFEDCEGASCVRIKYWRLVATLFSESYAKTIHEFCEKHNKKFTGHLLLEEDMRLQMISNGAVMPSYQYFDIPGIDMLTLIKEPGTAIIAPYQVASVAHQFGKRRCSPKALPRADTERTLTILPQSFPGRPCVERRFCAFTYHPTR